MSNNLETELVRALVEESVFPYIGRFMARSSTELHLSKLGITGSTMTYDEMKALVDRLAQAMRVLVGNDKTDEVAARILAAADEARGRP